MIDDERTSRVAERSIVTARKDINGDKSVKESVIIKAIARAESDGNVNSIRYPSKAGTTSLRPVKSTILDVRRIYTAKKNALASVGSDTYLLGKDIKSDGINSNMSQLRHAIGAGKVLTNS